MFIEYIVGTLTTVDQHLIKNGLKWGYYDEDVLPAWVAEMDFGIAPVISQTLHDAVDRGDTGYLYPAAIDATAKAATGFWAERLRWKVDPERVMAAPDVVEGTRRAIVHLTKPGSAVILPTPAYYPFFSMVERTGRDQVEVPGIVDEVGRYTLDLEGIDRAMTAGAGSLVLCNPWNPTGRSFTAGELSAVIEVVRGHGGRIISDEIHAPLTYTGHEHVAAAALAADTVITVTSASKAFNLPGLKCAQVVLTNDRDLEIWSNYFTLEKVGAGTFGLFANTAAYESGGDWLDDVKLKLESNRRLLGELLSAHLPDVGYGEPEATYLAWLDFSAYGHHRPSKHILEHARVALNAGTPFGSGEGYARLNFATTESVLTEMVERIADAL